MNDPSESATAAPLCFGQFELFLHTGELWREGEAVHLPPLPMRALCLLARSPNHLVTHEQLRDEIWDRPPLEWEKGLYACMLQVRRALGESEASTRVIETIPRRGYRLLLDNQTLGAASPDQHDPKVSGWPRKPWTSRTLFGSLFALTLVATGLLAVRLLEQTSPVQDIASRTTATSVAVTPLLQEGRYLLQQHRSGSLETAAERFREAAELDPHNAQAWSGLSYARMMRQIRGLTEPGPARDAAHRALALDPQLAEPHLVLGELAVTENLDHRLAQVHFDQALRLQPNSIPVRMHFASFLLILGRFDEAVQEVEWALAQDAPLALLAGDAAWIFHFAGQQDRAAWAAQRAIALEPERQWLLGLLVQIYLAQGQYDQAAENALAFLNQVDSSSDWSRANSQQIIERYHTIQLQRSKGASDMTLALRHAALGHNDQALIAIERAHSEQAPDLLRMIRHPALLPLHGDRRFQVILDSLLLGRRPGSGLAEKGSGAFFDRDAWKNEPNPLFVDPLFVEPNRCRPDCTMIDRSA